MKRMTDSLFPLKRRGRGRHFRVRPALLLDILYCERELLHKS